MSKILIIGHSVLDKIYTQHKFVSGFGNQFCCYMPRVTEHSLLMDAYGRSTINDSKYPKTKSLSVYYKNEFKEKPGGIFHTVNTLLNLGNSCDEFTLITQTSEKSYKYFSSIYDKINMEYSESVDEIPTVTLNLYVNKERDECFNKVNKKINISNKIDFKKFDIILVNMISGFDITHQDLREIKAKSNCKIYFDIHTLSRGLDEAGKRDFRKIPEIDMWLKSIDFLQMNENEMETIFEKIHEKEIVDRIFEFGVEGIVITKGSKGATCYTQNSKSKIAPTNVDAKNFVGCGDSFGAAFCYHFSNNNSFNSAVVFANFVAGIITTYQSFNDFKELKNDIKREYD